MASEEQIIKLDTLELETDEPDEEYTKYLTEENIKKEERQVNAKLWADRHTLEHAGGIGKFDLKEAITMLQVTPINYHIISLEKEGIDYMRHVLLDYLDLTWVEVKKKLGPEVFNLFLDKLEIVEREMKEIWTALKKQSKEEDKIWQEEYTERRKEEKKPKHIELGFIWDEKDLTKERMFPCDVINDRMYFGLLLPKRVENVIDGKVIGKMQTKVACIITSNKEMIEWTIRSVEDYNFSMNNIPTKIPYRWKLNHIKNFIDGTTERVDGEELIENIAQTYNKYVFMVNPTWYKIHALWDVATYFYQLFEAFPFIELRGIAGTGKSKTMTISSYLTFNGGNIMINPSESTLFRWKDDVKGTTYIDEAEKLWVYNPSTKQYEGDTRTELINASYTKEGEVPRMERNGRDKFETKWYRPYGPVMLGSINGLYGATETRAICRITTKSPNDDSRGEIEPSESRFEPIWENLRDMCYRFALENWSRIKKIYYEFNESKLKRRDFQIWKPLLSLAKGINEDMFKEIESFAVEVSNQRTEDFIPDTSFDYAVLSALGRCLRILPLPTMEVKKGESKQGKIYIKTIKESYCIEQRKPESLEDKYLNRNISVHLDKLGFKEFRKRDEKSSYFEIHKENFNQIVGPIVPELVQNVDETAMVMNQKVYIPLKAGIKNDEKVIKSDKIMTEMQENMLIEENRQVPTYLHTSTYSIYNNNVDSNVAPDLSTFSSTSHLHPINANFCKICGDVAVVIKGNNLYCEKHMENDL